MNSSVIADYNGIKNDAIDFGEEKDSYSLTKAESECLRKNYKCFLKGYKLKNQSRFFGINDKKANDTVSIKLVKEYYALSPEPIHQSKVNENIYITFAKQTHNLDYVYIFLHFYEKKLNSRIDSLISPRADLKTKVEQYIEIKMQCREYIFKKFLHFDETRGIEFTSYIYEGIRGAILNVLMSYNDYSFSSVDEYSNFRLMSYLLDNSDFIDDNIVEIDNDDSELSRYQKAIKYYIKKRGCSIETATDVMKAVLSTEYRVFDDDTYETEIEDENGDNTPIKILENVQDYETTRWLHDDYIGFVPSKDIYHAFQKLSYKEQRIVENRLAMCMKCKRVSDLAFKQSFEDIALDFELKSPRTAEKIYRNALNKIAKSLIEESDFDGAEIKLISKEGNGIKTKSAIYNFRPYYPENEYKWGTIEFNLITGDTKISKPFLFDAYENEVINYIKAIPVSNIPKEAIIPFI